MNDQETIWLRQSPLTLVLLPAKEEHLLRQAFLPHLGQLQEAQRTNEDTSQCKRPAYKKMSKQLKQLDQIGELNSYEKGEEWR